MNKKRVNIVRDNSKQMHFKHPSSFDADKVPKTISELKVDRIRPVTSKSSGRNSPIKPLMIASLSAVLIGVVLGLILLNLFTNSEDQLVQEVDQIGTVPTNSGNTGKVQGNIATLKEMRAFVLQIGVFSESVNAEEWASAYHTKGFPTMIMESDGQYFLLAGISGTAEGAKGLATKIEKENFDVFVKEWVTSETDAELTEEEYNWLENFQSLWGKALQSVSKQEGLLIKEWNDLLKDNPAESQGITGLVEEIDAILKNEQEVNDLESQNILLNIWNQYEEFIK